MSDWYAMNSGVASALGGLDAVLPTPLFWGLNGSTLIAAVKNGSIPESRLDDMATRIVAAWYQVGQDSGYTLPGDGTTLDFVAPHKKVYARDPKSKPIILQNAIEGHVLVKNVNGALPLKKDVQMLSVFGYDAHAPLIMNVPDAAGPVYMNGWGVGAESTDPSLLNMLGTTQRSPAAAYNGTLIHAGEATKLSSI
jgi:beta-glucosidase